MDELKKFVLDSLEYLQKELDDAREDIPLVEDEYVREYLINIREFADYLLEEADYLLESQGKSIPDYREAI